MKIDLLVEKYTKVDEGVFARLYDEIEDYVDKHKEKLSKEKLYDYVWKTFKNKDKNMTEKQFKVTFEEIWERA